jgi:DNA topoisomerase-1
LSNDALISIRSLIENKYGLENLPKESRIYKTKSKSAQEAHEAIRPTDVNITPTEASEFLDKDDLALYSLIWRRTVACQMIPAEYKRRAIDVKNLEYLFRNSDQVLMNSGYLNAYEISPTELSKNEIKENDTLFYNKFDHNQHYTQPPARYNEASLIKSLESFGIGRPSTYAAIISTIQQRGYVTKENKAFKPEDVGYVVTDLLQNHFENIVDVDFTSKMEDDLDQIASGKKEWIPVIDSFYKPFIKRIEEKGKEINKEDIVVLGESEEKCELCGSKMVIKLGRFGRFLSCSKFPECKGIKSLSAEENLEELFEKYEEPKECSVCKSKMEL